jgi:hypothetical protein
MQDRFSRALLAALNESAEVKESEWNSIAAVLRAPIDSTETRPQERVFAPVLERRLAATAPVSDSRLAATAPVPENRFAATVSCCMARLREGR